MCHRNSEGISYIPCRWSLLLLSLTVKISLRTVLIIPLCQHPLSSVRTVSEVIALDAEIFNFHDLYQQSEICNKLPWGVGEGATKNLIVTQKQNHRPSFNLCFYGLPVLKDRSLYLALVSPGHVVSLLCHFVFLKFTRADLF